MKHENVTLQQQDSNSAANSPFAMKNCVFVYIQSTYKCMNEKKKSIQKREQRSGRRVVWSTRLHAVVPILSCCYFEMDFEQRQQMIGKRNRFGILFELKKHHTHTQCT